jgi:hypothetical protein
MSNRYKGAIISATPPTTTGGESGVASGAWTLEQQMQLQAAGLWPSQPPPPYIEAVFSTYLYTGNGSTQTIVNGINLAAYGGMVWLKPRSESYSHKVYDTIRGGNSRILTNTTDAASTGYITSFNSNGFSKNYDLGENTLDQTYVSWTFRKQPKFFDIVTWTGDDVSNRRINHLLGSTPGCMFYKNTSNASDWGVWHRSMNANQNPWDSMYLNKTDAKSVITWFGDGASPAGPTSTQIVVKGAMNNAGQTYVAYLFAHDAGGFGLTETENVISCGSYTGNGSTTGPVITLGYEPQWLMVKKSSGLGDWVMVDSMRGIVTGGVDPRVWANLNSAENTGDFLFKLNATGFQPESLSDSINASGSTYIYIAIRRGPMAVPTTGTSVFAIDQNTSSPFAMTSGFPVDSWWYGQRAGSGKWFDFDRLRGSVYLQQNTTAAEVAYTAKFDNMTGVSLASDNATGYIQYAFRRAPSFFDEVCYTGNGSTQTITHNLTVVPELIIAKNRGQAGNNWPVLFNFASTTMNYGFLNLTNSCPNDTYANVGVFSAAPTSTSMFLTNSGSMNGSGYGIVAYLFATCAGVSKVGSYTGTGTTQTINCGFTAGARFVLIKRTDSTGDWYVWDSTRGIIAGDDPYLLLNSTAAEVTNTDYVDTATTGFEISSTAPAAINANGGTFIFLAIA